MSLLFVCVSFSIFILCLGACRALINIIVLVSSVCLFYVDIRILITEITKKLLTSNLLSVCTTKDGFSAIFALFLFVLEIKLTLNFEFNSCINKSIGSFSFPNISTTFFSNFFYVSVEIFDIYFSPFMLVYLFVRLSVLLI